MEDAVFGGRSLWRKQLLEEAAFGGSSLWRKQLLEEQLLEEQPLEEAAFEEAAFEEAAFRGKPFLGEIRRRRWLISAQGWNNPGSGKKEGINPERVRREINPFRVLSE